jgi:hypothetical protein
MHCNTCNRLLIARDAKLLDPHDSTARLELHCECGAVYSAFVDDSAWIFGLAGNDTRGLICQREWVRTPQGVIRWLSVSDYSLCEHGHVPREFMHRLPLNDPRPWGMEMTGMAHCGDWLASLPVGQWSEIVSAEPQDL